MILSFNAEAQLIKEYKKYAYQAFDKGDYKQAMDNFFQAYLKDSFNLKLLYKYAESARLYQSYDNAHDAYKKLLSVDDFSEFDMAYFHLAQIAKIKGEYKQAFEYFNTFKEVCQDKTSYPFYKTNYELLNESKILKIASDTNNNYYIHHFDIGINSEYAELAPNLYKDKELYITSLRLPEEETVKNNEKLAQQQFHILKYNNQLGFWNQEPFDIPYQPKRGRIVHIGNYEKLDNDESYFTVCKPKGASALSCNIYIHKNGEPVRKLEGINHLGGTTTQPYVYRKNGRVKIYFASDRPGGYGQMDIWIASLDQDGYVTSVLNCGDSINTPGNEMSPFFLADSNQLFFSSDWHPGLGGLDVFSANKSNDSLYTQIQNLGMPINSGINELDFEWSSDGKRAYFASNRLGSFFINGEYCCHDIYEVQVMSDSEIIAKQNQYQYIEDYDAIEPNYEDSVKVFIENEKPNNFNKVFYSVTKTYIELSYPTVYFDFNSFKLNDVTINTLDSVISIIKRDELNKIELAAHTDGKGSDIYNLRLSKKRATYVKTYMVSKGIEESFISFGFYGEKEPIAPNAFEDGKDNPEGRKLNRRVELRYSKETD